MARLVLVRHGQSEWNLQNRFTGWVDVDLTEKGIAEAARAGVLLRDLGGEYAAAFTSVQTRAIKTLNIALGEMDRLWLPVAKSWRLNERHYGALTGLDKTQTAEKHGVDQVKIWRRSYDTPPPQMDPASKHNPAIDPRYSSLSPSDIPLAESLKLTLERVEPYWATEIEPRLASGDNLIVAAHGNSLRALVKLLMNVSDEDIVGVEIPTGNPLIFELEDNGITPKSAQYLDKERATPIPALK